MSPSTARRALRRSIWPGAIVALAGGAGVLACTSLAPRPAGSTLMILDTQIPGGSVGVVRRADLLVAYHKSPRFSRWLDGLRADRDAATARGDAAAATRYEAFGSELQEVAHRQLAGREPLYTIVVGAQVELRAVMEARGLCWLREAGPGVEGVDVTDDVVQALTASPAPTPDQPMP